MTGPFDSEPWTCQDCHGSMIGQRTPDDLCGHCIAARLRVSPQTDSRPEWVRTCGHPGCVLTTTHSHGQPGPAAGPFATERAASAEVRRAYGALRPAPPAAGSVTRLNGELLTRACAGAGVELGAYDHQILRWLAGWEPGTCAVIAGLITRAAAPARPGAVMTAVSFARAALAASRSRAFPSEGIAMAPFPFDGTAFMTSDSAAWRDCRPLVTADALKAELERAIEGLLEAIEAEDPCIREAAKYGVSPS